MLSKLYDSLLKQKTVVRILIGIAMMVLPFLARGVNEAFDFLYAPMFIFGLVSIVKILECKKCLFPLTFLGKYSLLLWFLHCAFANQLKNIIQPVLYYPRNPVLVTIFGLAMCLAVAVMIQIPINGINKLKNKLFRCNYSEPPSKSTKIHRVRPFGKLSLAIILWIVMNYCLIWG